MTQARSSLRHGLRTGILAAAILSAAGCAREQDTLAMLGFERPIANEFAVGERVPLTLPPDFNLLPPVSENYEDYPAGENRSYRQVTRALLQALSDLGSFEAPQERLSSPGDLSPGAKAFLTRFQHTGNPDRVGMTVDQETTGLRIADPDFVRRLYLQDPAQPRSESLP